MVAAFLPCQPGAYVDIPDSVLPGIRQEAEVDVERLVPFPLMIVGGAALFAMCLSVMRMVSAEQTVLLQSLKQRGMVHAFRMIFVPDRI